MKKTYLLLLALFISLASCTDTKVGDVDLDFDADLSPKTGTTFVGKPVEIDIRVSNIDTDNTYPFTTVISGENLKIAVSGETVNSGAVISHDYKNDGALRVELTPTEQGNRTVTITVKNTKVTKELKYQLDCEKFFFESDISGIPERTIIETRFDFDLLLKEMENTQTDSVRAYARVVKGEGTVYTGEQVISDGETTATRSGGLAIGKNTVSYLSRKEGENIIRFYVTNKWGNETSFDVPVEIDLPQWSLSDTFEEGYNEIPFDDPYSFNLSVDEADIFDDNTYTGSYRILSNTDLKLSINNQEYNQGATFQLKAGANVGVIQIQDASQGEIEFIVQDKFKQENKDTIRFTSKMPVKPIEATLDQNSQSVKVNQPATFKLTLSEVNYSDVFTINMEIIEGQGTFENGDKQTFSEGTHNIRFTPTAGGTHTFKITVTDKNDQEKVLNATVQSSLQLLSANLNVNSVDLIHGESQNVTLSVSEEDYNGRYFIKYKSSGIGGTVTVNGTILGEGQTASFTDNECTLNFTGTNVGVTNYLFTVSDEYQQEKNVDLTATVKANISVIAGTGGSVSGGGRFDLNQDCKVTATPANGYAFEGWYDNNALVSTDPVYTFKVTKSATLEGRFTINTYSIKVNTGEGGTTTGGGNYAYGSTCVLKATVYTGYTFDGWYEGTQKISGALEYSFQVNKSQTINAQFTPNTYNITANAGTGGTVTGGGTYKHNSTCTVIAKVSEGYTFDGWYESNQKVSNSTTYEFTVIQSITLEARFDPNAYGVTVNADEGGTVTGGGNFYHGDNITVIATPSTGYEFIGWYEDTKQLSTSERYNFTITKAITLTAKFQPKEYSIVVNTTTGGTATGGGKYKYNTNATVVATVSQGYSFSGWYEGTTHLSNSLSYTFKVTQDKSVEARFTPNTYTVTVNATIGGTASGSGSYSYGQNVTVTAVPETHYSFDGWYENAQRVSTSPQYTFVLKGVTNLEARFSTKKYSIEATSTNGTVTGGGMYDYGSTVSLYATPANAYSFSGWYEDNELITGVNPYSFRVEKARLIEARYTQIRHTITLQAEEGGAVTGGGTFVHGTNATIKAVPDADFLFNGWYDTDNILLSNSAEYTFKVEKAYDLTGRFRLNEHTITLVSGGNGTVAGAGTYIHGKQVTAKATPNYGYVFEGWYNGTSLVSKSANYIFTATQNISLTAKFVKDKFTVNLDYFSRIHERGIAYGPECGTLTGGGTYDYQTAITLTATPAPGYKLEHYSETIYTSPATVNYITTNPYRFTLEKDRVIYAKFCLIESNISPTFTYNKKTFTGKANRYVKVGEGTSLYVLNIRGEGANMNPRVIAGSADIGRTTPEVHLSGETQTAGAVVFVPRSTGTIKIQLFGGMVFEFVSVK